VLFSGAEQLPWVYALCALVAVFAWAALWRPYVATTDAGVHVRNVSHTVDIPWRALIHIDTKHAMTLITPGGRFAVWSAPAPGLIAGLAAGRNSANREARAAGEAVHTSDFIGTDSGDAALVVREEWKRRRDAGLIPLGEAGEDRVRRVPDVPVIAAFAVLVAATIAAIAIGR